MMKQIPSSRRFLHGAVEGALIGLVVALIRSGLRLYSEGLPDQLASHAWGIIGYFAINIVACAYIFAMGRAIADGIFGSLIGASLLAFAGLFAGLSLLDRPSDFPYSVAAGAAVGCLLGAPLGAWVSQRFRPPKQTESA